MANLATINNNILADSGIDPLSLIVGTGTVNYVPKFTAEDTIANSLLRDNGTSMAIGAAPISAAKFYVYGGTLGVNGGNLKIGNETSPGNDGFYIYKSSDILRIYKDSGAFGGANTSEAVQLDLYDGTGYNVRISGDGLSYLKTLSVGTLTAPSLGNSVRMAKGFEAYITSDGYPDRSYIIDTDGTGQLDFVSYPTGGNAYSNSIGIFKPSNASGKDLLLMSGNANIRFVTGLYTEAMRVTNSQTVNIGNTTNTTYKFYVNGTSYFNNTITANDNIAMSGGEFYYGGTASNRFARTYVSGTANAGVLNFSFFDGTNWNIRSALSYTGSLKLNAYGAGSFTGTPTYRLAVDSSGNVIEVTDGGGTVTGSGVAGQVAYWDGTSSITSESGFLWDATNNRLGIGVTPSYNIHALGTGVIGYLKSTASTNTNTYAVLQLERSINTAQNGVGIAFSMLDSASALEEYGYIGAIIENNSAGTEQGNIGVFVTKSGSVRKKAWVMRHDLIEELYNYDTATSAHARRYYDYTSNELRFYAIDASGNTTGIKLMEYTGSQYYQVLTTNTGLPLTGGTISGALTVTGALTSNGQFVVNNSNKTYYAIGASDDVRLGVAMYDTTAQAAGVGGQIVLGYKYTDAGDYTEGGIIKMYKLNGTSGDYSSGLKFQVRNTGAGLSTKMTLDPSGNLSLLGIYTAQSTGGNGLRIYGAAGTNQWDMYLNGTNLRFSDNTGTGKVVFDTVIQAPLVSVTSSAVSVILNRTGGTTFGAGIQYQTSGTNNWIVGTAQASVGTDYSIYNYNTGSGALNISYTNNAATFSSSVTASSLIKSGGTSSQYLMADGSVSTLTNPVTGTGTTNRLSKWTSSSALGDANVTDNGSTVRINTIPFVVDSRLGVGVAGNDQNYASIFVGGAITTGVNQYAILLDPQLAGSGDNYAVFANPRIKADTAVTNTFGVYIPTAEKLSGATIVNSYALYIANQTSGSTTNYSIYSSGGLNYFGGSMGIGSTPNANNKLYLFNGNFGINGGNFRLGNETSTNNEAFEFYKSSNILRVYRNGGAFGGTYSALDVNFDLYDGTDYNVRLSAAGNSYVKTLTVGSTTSPTLGVALRIQNGFQAYITEGVAPDRCYIIDSSGNGQLDFVSYPTGGDAYANSIGIFKPPNASGKDLLLMSGSANIRFVTGSYTEVMRATNSGSLLVGTTNADVGGSVAGTIIRSNGTMAVCFNDASPANYQSPFAADRRNSAGDGLMYAMWRVGIFQSGIGATNTQAITFITGDGSNANQYERLRISSGGLILANTTSSRTTGYTTNPAGHYAAEMLNYGGAHYFTNVNNAEGSYLVLGKSRGTSVNSLTAVQNGDILGGLIFEGTTGTQTIPGVGIFGNVDGTVTTANLPSRLSFWTSTASGSLVERMRILNGGQVHVGAGAPSSDAKLVVSGFAHFSNGENSGATFNIQPASTGQGGVNLNASYWTGTGYPYVNFTVGGNNAFRITPSKEFWYWAEDNATARANIYYNLANNEYRIYATNGSGSTTGVKLMEYNGTSYYQVLTTNTGLALTGGTLSGGLTVNSRIQNFVDIGPDDNIRTGLVTYDTRAMAAGVGGQLVLGYKYTSAGDYTEGAIIKMYKENATSGHYGSGLKFQVRNTGADISTKMTLTPSGRLLINTGSEDSGKTLSVNGAWRASVVAGGANASDRCVITEGSNNLDFVSYVAGGDAYSGSMGMFINGGKDLLLMAGNAAIRFVTGGYTEVARATNGQEFWIGYTSDQGAYKLQVNGSTYSSSGFFESSDIRLKTIINRHQSADFDAIEYNWNDGRDSKLHWGYAAQEVMKFLPDAVSGTEELFYTLDYNQVHTYKIAMLEKRIAELEKQLKNK